MIKNSVRQPITEGLFFPSDREELTKIIQESLGDVQGAHGAILIPHASYEVINPAYGRAWAQVAQRDVKTVLLLGPVHREPGVGVALAEASKFASPLGEINLDNHIIDKLVKLSPLFKVDPIPHEEEHCLELTLPYISTLFPQARIIPALVGKNTRSNRRKIATALREVLLPLKENLLVIITSNLSNYTSVEEAQREADLFCELVEKKREPGEKDKLGACGQHCLEIFQHTHLFEGKFKLKERFPMERKENRKAWAIHYGTMVFEESILDRS